MCACLLTSALAPASANAQTTEHPGLLRVIAAYQAGELSQAQAVLATLPPSLPAPDQAIRLLYRGLIQFALGHTEPARDSFARALETMPGLRLDPAVHAPSRVRLFETARDSLVLRWRRSATEAEAQADTATAARIWGRVAEAMPSDTIAVQRIVALRGTPPPRIALDAGGERVRAEVDSAASIPVQTDSLQLRAAADPDSTRLPAAVPPPPRGAAAETEAAPQVGDESEPAAPRLNPGQAAMLGLVVPGLGEIYAGRPAVGMLVLAGAGGALAAGLLVERISVDCLSVPVNDQCPPDDIVDQRSERPYLVPGIAGAAAMTLFGAIDAFLAARRANARAAVDTRSEASERGIRLQAPAVEATATSLRLDLVRIRF